jgi:hypothetical protein
VPSVTRLKASAASNAAWRLKSPLPPERSRFSHSTQLFSFKRKINIQQRVWGEGRVCLVITEEIIDFFHKRARMGVR